MASFNKVLLMGNLTRKPELRYTPSGMAVCEFTLAVNRRYSQGNETKEDVCFVDITVWDRQADNCSKYLDKGSSVFIEGRLQLDRWVDKNDQKQRSRLRVVAETVQFVGSRRDGGAPAGDYGDGQSYARRQPDGQQQYSPDAMPQQYSRPRPAYGQPQQGQQGGGIPPQMPSQPSYEPQPQPYTRSVAPAPQAAPEMPEPADNVQGIEDDIPF